MPTSLFLCVYFEFLWNFLNSNGCAGADGCDWTTCLDDITPSGIGHASVDGFIPQLYDYMEVGPFLLFLNFALFFFVLILTIGNPSCTLFVLHLYDICFRTFLGFCCYLKQNFCIDVTREYHSGMSNGAMFTYQAGASMSSRLAAIVPVAGSFHNVRGLKN